MPDLQYSSRTRKFDGLCTKYRMVTNTCPNRLINANRPKQRMVFARKVIAVRFANRLKLTVPYQNWKTEQGLVLCLSINGPLVMETERTEKSWQRTFPENCLFTTREPLAFANILNHSRSTQTYILLLLLEAESAESITLDAHEMASDLWLVEDRS